AAAILGAGLLAALMVAPAASAHPGETHAMSEAGGLGVEILAPDGLSGFLGAVQWGDTGEVADQRAELVYVGSGCSPVSYAGKDVEDKIAFADAEARNTAGDPCPASTFAQLVQSAERAGAIGFVHLPAEGAEPNGNATAVQASIPALDLFRTDDAVAVRDAIRGGARGEAMLTDTTEPIASMSDVPCVDGQAGPFACDGVDLLSLTAADEIDSAGISDLWGWTDADEGGEYVIMGKTNGVAFFRITDPLNPEYLGELPNPGLTHETWHDIKVYDDHAFIVSESQGHGMTIFDLTRLRDVRDGDREGDPWDNDAVYRLATAAHNLEINTETGFAYIVGGNAGIAVPDQCLSGLHMVDINEPKNPTFAGCYLFEGGPGTAARVVGPPVTEVSPAAYVHDAQCVIYRGPDEEHHGKEICLNAAEDKIVIVDVTNKLAPVTLGVTDYEHVAYAHQNWLDEDQEFLFVNDELDEQTHDEVTTSRTVVLDVRDLDNPKPHHYYEHEYTESITHNNYVVGDHLYQSNYSSGLRVADISGIADGHMEEVGFFDTYPTNDDTNFDGTWSNYPFFESGTIAVSGRAEGLFLLRLTEETTVEERGVDIACVDCPVEIRSGERGTAAMTVTNTGNVGDTYVVTVDGLPDGWTATADPDTVAVDAGATEGVDVTIDVPRKARAGSYVLTVTATSAQDPGVSDAAEVDVEVVKGRPSDAGRSGGSAGSAGSDGDGRVTAAGQDDA
ncbi:MAG: choice-of-anchor B family protein, partial [Nitriliruptor sp.]